MDVVLIAVIALPLAGAVAAVVMRAGFTAGGVVWLGATASGAAFAGAVVLAGPVVAGSGTGTAVGWWGSDGSPVIGWATDWVAVVLLLLVLGVSAVVQVFARRYLEGDPRAGWFTGWAGVLTTASAGLVTSVTLFTLAVCWTAAGVALCGLLATYPHVPAARVGVARTMRVFLVGDLALWAAVVAVALTWGTLDLQGLGVGATPGHPLVLAVVACAVVVAALTRSAQVPAHRWLPATLAAPTPVSALLHAGVVNAGGILLVKLGGLLGAVPAAGALAFTAGALTALWGTVLMLAKPDVKGSLAHSTMGQMGFMVMTCGLGLYALAVFHLVAHGMYKATLFLASGTAVRHHRARRAAPPPGSVLPARALLPVLVAPAAALTLGVLTVPAPGGYKTATEVLLVFAWTSAAAAGWGWARRHPTPRGVTVAALGAALTALAYLAWVQTVSHVLAPALPAPSPLAPAPWLLLGVLAVFAAVTLLWRAAPEGVLGGLRHDLYVTVLRAGHVHPRSVGWSGGHRMTVPLTGSPVGAPA